MNQKNGQRHFPICLRAADDNDPQSQYNLGWMFRHGKGVSKDAAEAARWFKLSAGQGHANAQVNLGVMYEYGIGVDKDADESEKWYIFAYDQGFVKDEYKIR